MQTTEAERQAFWDDMAKRLTIKAEQERDEFLATPEGQKRAQDFDRYKGKLRSSRMPMKAGE